MCARTLECKSKETNWFKGVFIPPIKNNRAGFPAHKVKEVPTVRLPSHRWTWEAPSHQNLMRTRSVYRSARSVPWSGEKTLALTEDKTWQAMTKARGHQNPPLRPRSRTAGFWGAIVGSKNLTTTAHFILGLKPTLRKKKCPRTNEESPNCQAASPRTILSSANRDYRTEERHAIKGRLAEHPKKKDKYCGSAMGAWWRSSSRRNCHLRIKCPQLTFWPH